MKTTFYFGSMVAQHMTSGFKIIDTTIMYKEKARAAKSLKDLAATFSDTWFIVKTAIHQHTITE